MEGRGSAEFAQYAPPRATMTELPGGTVTCLLVGVEGTAAHGEQTASYALQALESA